MKRIMRLIAFIAFALTAAFVCTTGALAATVAVTVEKNAIGESFIVEPTLVTVTGGAKTSDVIINLLYEKFPDVRACESRGTGNQFYLSGVYDPKRGRLLKEMDIDFSGGSGWMVTVANYYITTSAGVRSLQDKEVMRWQFTDSYGRDLGQISLESLGPNTLANKDALTWKVAEINRDGDKSSYGWYTKALSVLTTLNSTQSAVDEALAALNSKAPAPSPDPEPTPNPDPNPTPDPSTDPDDNATVIEPSAPNLPDKPDNVGGGKPTIISDRDVLAAANMPVDWMIQGKGGYVVSKGKAKEIAAKLGIEAEETVSLPAFSAPASEAGGVVAAGLDVIGASLLAERPRDIKLIKILSAGPDGAAKTPLEFRYSETGYEDGTFRLQTAGGDPYTGTIEAKTTYMLVLFIKDGGSYDIDEKKDGTVYDPAVIVRAKASDNDSEETGGTGGGGGCDAGLFGLLPLVVGFGFSRLVRGTR